MPVIVAGENIQKFRYKSRGFWLFAWISAAAATIGTGSFFLLFKHPALPYIGWITSVLSVVALAASVSHWVGAFKIEFFWKEKGVPEHLEYLEPNFLQTSISSVLSPIQHLLQQDDLNASQEVKDARRFFSAKVHRRFSLFFYMMAMFVINVILLVQLIQELVSRQ